MTNPSNSDAWQTKMGLLCTAEGSSTREAKREPLKLKQDVMQLFYAHSGPVIAAVAWICIPATLKGLLDWMEL